MQAGPGIILKLLDNIYQLGFQKYKLLLIQMYYGPDTIPTYVGHVDPSYFGQSV